jgi:hypothetical protein
MSASEDSSLEAASPPSDVDSTCAAGMTMERERKQEIQLLGYMHRLLTLFREARPSPPPRKMS